MKKAYPYHEILQSLPKELGTGTFCLFGWTLKALCVLNEGSHRHRHHMFYDDTSVKFSEGQTYRYRTISIVQGLQGDWG
jgi:hypothetical protein